MILEVSQYLENYLWPNFELVMWMMLMIYEKSLEDDIVSETILRLASLQSWHSLSYWMVSDLIKKWKRKLKREANEAAKLGEEFAPATKPEVKFLRNLMEEFLKYLIPMFSWEHTVDGDVALNYLGQVGDACVLYCERFMEFLIHLLSQLPTRRGMYPQAIFSTWSR